MSGSGNRRRTWFGSVISNKMDKTVVVAIEAGGYRDCGEEPQRAPTSADDARGASDASCALFTAEVGGCQLEQGECCFNLMKTGGLTRENAEEQVDLGVRCHAHGPNRGHALSPSAAVRSSRSPRCSRDSDQKPSSVMGRKVVR